MKTKKIALEKFKVNSFVTEVGTEKEETVKGGAATIYHVYTNQLGCTGPVIVWTGKRTCPTC